MIPRYWWMVVCLLAISLGGCVVIPIHVDEAEPYEDAAGQLLDGFTIREEVLARFGQPSAVYSHGALLVYTDFEKNWEFPYLLAAPNMPPAVGVGIAGDRHFLILEFDERGILIDHRDEIGKGWSDCSPTGFCHSRAAGGHIIWLADKPAEAEAKAFPVYSEQCGVYIYIDGYRVFDAISLVVDGDNLGPVNLVGSGFFHVPVDPGEHVVSTDQSGLDPGSAALPVTCRENEHIFVRLKIKRARSSPVILERVDNAKGRRKVKGRRLIIPQSPL